MTANAKIRDSLKRLIREAESPDQNPFSGEAFEGITRLEIDARGRVGERFVSRLLQDRGDSVVQNDQTNPQGKQWDIKVSLPDGTEITAEVKTATMGKGKTPTFQHENLPRNRKCDILVLIDVAPNAVYGTVALLSELPWEEKGSQWTARPKKMHLRRDGQTYKWDLTVRDVQDREISTPAKFHTMWDDAVRRLTPKTGGR